MSAEDNLQAEQFGKGWTPKQRENMSALDRINAATGKTLAKLSPRTRFGRISDFQPIRSPQNWY